MSSLLDRLASIFAARHARAAYERFVAATADAATVQQRVLAAKIRAHRDSDFGRDHHFDRIRDYNDFKRNVPLCTYDDLRPYIERLLHGQSRALLGGKDKPLMFALTSGTTAEPKYIPVTRQFLAEYRRGWNAWGLKALLDHPGTMLRGICQMASPMDERSSPAGIPCGAITGLTAATQKRLVRKYYVVPLEVAYISDAAARYYTAMRFAAARDVAWLIAANPATLLRLAEAADTHAETLIKDIHDGSLTPPGEVDPDVLARLRRLCRPEPERARRLHEAARKSGRLRPRDFWRLGFLACWTGGTMGLYLSDLPAWYGPVPIRDVGLIASEGRMSIPVEDGTPAGILEVTSSFYEFIPAEQIDEEAPTTLRCHELEPGRQYYIILTTSAGLFRYHINDLVQVVGYAGRAPIIEFLSKGQRISSLAGEKLTENQVVLAAARVEEQLRLRLGDFALCPRWASPPGYILYLDEQCAEPLQTIAKRFDEALCRINIEYASKRKTLRLDPVRVRLLRRGFLAELDAQALARRRGRAEQFKHRFLYTDPGDDADWPVVSDRNQATPGDSPEMRVSRGNQERSE